MEKKSIELQQPISYPILISDEKRTTINNNEQRIPMKTKGQLEADISNAITQFEKDYLGRGPRESRTFIIQDMVLIRLKGILTPAEETLATQPDGARLIKEMRMRLIESSRPLLESLVTEKTGLKIVSLHTDISAKSGERVFIFVLEKNLENILAGKS